MFKPTYMVHSVNDIEKDFFKKENIKLVLCDIDNTLVADNEPYADDSAKKFVARMKQEEIELCLVSNNTRSRVDSFNSDFGLEYIYRARKPFCYKMDRLIRKKNADKDKVLFIGDQLLTDIPAGNRCKIRTMLVDPINISKENTFFKLKRFIEKKLLNRNFR